MSIASVQLPLSVCNGLSMADVEQRIRAWGATQPGLLSFKVARGIFNPTCRVALDVVGETDRTRVHAAFCALEETLLREISFDLEWMTFSVDEYPIQRRAFFHDCYKPGATTGDASAETQCADLIVFPERLSPEIAPRWAQLVCG